MKFGVIFFLLSFIGVEETVAKFESTDEVSLVTTGGNTDLKTYNAKSDSNLTFGKNIFNLSGSYTYGETDGVRGAERWDAKLRYDRELFESLNAFLAELVESNRYAGFARRFNTDVGLKYFLVKSETNKTFVEAGYRYTVEKKKDDTIADQKDSKGRLFAETKHNFSKTVMAKFWIEYLPNFTLSEDYLINMEPSLVAALGGIFSIKLSYLWNYDNFPVPGNGKHDYTYTTSLIANF